METIYGSFTQAEWREFKKLRADKVRTYQKKYKDLSAERLRFKKTYQMFESLRVGHKPPTHYKVDEEKK